MKQTSSLNHEMRRLSAAVIASLAATGTEFPPAQAADAAGRAARAPCASAAARHPSAGMGAV